MESNLSNYVICDDNDDDKGPCDWFDIFPPESMNKLYPYLLKLPNFDPPIWETSSKNLKKPVPVWLVNYDPNIQGQIVESFDGSRKYNNNIIIILICIFIIIAFFLI